MKKLGDGRRALTVIVGVTAVAVTLLGAVSGSAASSGVQGRIATQPVTGAACPSVVGICFSGTMSGKAQGRADGDRHHRHSDS